VFCVREFGRETEQEEREEGMRERKRGMDKREKKV
jgi:hypothetical protein